jgi:hypothetical protein
VTAVAVRSLGCTEMAVGTAMVLAPRFVASLSRGPVPPTLIMRVLGTREIGQGVLTAARADRMALGFGAAVDIAHLASMVVLAAARPRWRRTASASGAVAVVFAAAGLALARAGATA